jgi:hypothetical protein
VNKFVEDRGKERLKEREESKKHAEKEAETMGQGKNSDGNVHNWLGGWNPPTVLGKHLLEGGKQPEAKKSRSSSPGIKLEAEDSDTKAEDSDTNLRSIGTIQKFPEIRNPYSVRYEEALQAARPSRNVQLRNVYTGFQAMLKLTERFHIDVILPQLFRGLVQMAEASLIAPQSQQVQRGQTTPVDDISRRFQSGRDEFLDRIKACSSGISLARRMKAKQDLGKDLLSRLGCNQAKGVSYATHMYEVLCFSDIQGNFKAWPTYKNSPRFDKDKRTWEKRRRVGDMLWSDLGNTLSLGWLLLFPEDLKVLNLQDMTNYEMRMLCFILQRTDFYEPFARLADTLSPLVEKLSRAASPPTSLADCKGGLAALLRGIRHAIHHDSFLKIDYGSAGTLFDSPIVKMLGGMPWDSEEVLQIGLNHCNSRAVSCSKSDITRLCGNEWLNDNLILLVLDFILRLVTNNESSRSKLRVIDPISCQASFEKGRKLCAITKGLTFVPVGRGRH